jgi:hypothetical protein
MSAHPTTVVDALAAMEAPKREIERTLAELALGIVCALEESQTSIEQAENDLFNLETYNAVRNRRLSQHLAEMLEWGMELASVQDLAPEGLIESYESIKSLARAIISRPRLRTPRPRA